MLILRNEITGQLVAFSSTKPGRVSIYVCGITPYDTTHLGHAFTYLCYDALIRYLEYRGYSVRYVQNVTDIDDDVLRKSRETGDDWLRLGNRWTSHFINDLSDLNVRPPAVYPRATETIPDMFPAIEAMLRRGVAYVANGNVYYHVASDPDFGQVSGLAGDQWLSVANERGNHPDDLNKRDPLDFVLWQAQAPGEPCWESPWGPGRPGWHIECSTMAMKYLGQTIDIHGGGADLAFPHHECETAQACSVSGRAFFAKYWLHTAMVRYQGEKMSKSLGNLIWVSDLVQAHGADAVRVLVHNHPYYETWNYEAGEMQDAANLAQRLLGAAQIAGGNGSPVQVEARAAEFTTAMDDNLNTCQALQALARLADDITQSAGTGSEVTAAQATLRKLSAVLGLTLGQGVEPRVIAGWKAHLVRFA